MANKRARVFPNGLTAGQARLLQRHRRGLTRLIDLMRTRSGILPGKLLLILAHRRSGLGSTLARLDTERRQSTEATLIPGLTTELPTWLERLALTGPVVDCRHGTGDGPSIIVVDEEGEMALWCFGVE